MERLARRVGRRLLINVKRLEEELLDRIHGMLKRGELDHAPPDYWTARRNLERRRRRAARARLN